MAEHKQKKRNRPTLEPYPIIPAFPVEKRFTSEKPLSIISNYFPFKVLSKPIYCYSVVFEPLQYDLGVRKRFTLLSKIKSKLGGQYLFNGTNLFSQNTLDITSEKVVNEYVRQGEAVKEEFTISLNLLKLYKDHLDQHVLLLLNQIIHKSLFKMGFVQLGEHHFNPKESRGLQGGISKWPGFSTSAQLGLESGSFLLVDYKQKLIRSETAADVFSRCRDPNAIEQELVNRVVLTKYNNKTYRIKKIARDEKVTDTFNQFDRQQKKEVAISYIDYYQKSYGMKIQQTNLPLLIADHRMRNGKTQEIRLIPELCCLTGVTPRELAANRRELCKSSRDRSSEITSFMQRFVTNSQVKEVMDNWGIQLDTNPTKLNAFISPSQTLQMGKNSDYTADRDWKQIFREKKTVYKEIELKNWFIVTPHNCSRTAENFFREMKFVSQGMGIRISEPNVLKIKDDREETYIQSIQQASGIANSQFVLVFLANNSKYLYSSLKHFVTCELPVVSQFITENTCQKGKTIATNILVQVQGKLCGAPWKVKLPIPQDRYLMFVGISVLPGKLSSGATGAFCATLDRDCIRYYSKTFYKQSVDEIGASLGKYFEKALEEYKLINKVFPDSVIFYREGISDRSYKQVTEDEINKLKKVATEKGDSASITYIAVNKHVQSKFFVSSDRGNVPSGTVINRSIVAKDRAEFYLCSVTANQGTVNPICYNILANECKIPEKIIVTLTHGLTHMYFNWFGPVRTPAPLMYATKAATFIGDYVRDEPKKQLEMNLFFI